MSTNTCIKRLRRDLEEWAASAPAFPFVSVAPLDTNIMEWHFNVFHEASPAPVHGVIQFPNEYPLNPPRVTFACEVPHKQVFTHADSRQTLCLDMFDDGQQYGSYAHMLSAAATDRTTNGRFRGWSSAYGVTSMMVQIYSFLCEVFENNPEWANSGPLVATRCRTCHHAGRHLDAFFPPRRRKKPRQNRRRRKRRATHQPTSSSKRVWSMLYADVERLIFEFLEFGEMNRMNHVSRRIRQVLNANTFLESRSLRCYYSHCDFREFCAAIKSSESRATVKDMVFGLGITPEYWTNETRDGKTEKKLKAIHVSTDLFTYRGFRDGLRHSVWKDVEFTHFLPVYLNRRHGRYALPLAEKLIKNLYGVQSDHFPPSLALDFCAKLMNTTVVSLMKTIDEDTRDFTPRLFTSIKAIQTYMYFYHLLLGFVDKYPRILQRAQEKIAQFMEKPNERNKKNFPDLGEFLVYLTIAGVSWSKVGRRVIYESLVRNCKWLLEKYPSLISVGEKPISSCVRLRQSWTATVVGKRLFMFQVYFMQNICQMGRDYGMLFEHYNSNLGRAEERLALNLQRECRLIFQVEDWFSYFRRIQLPCPSATRLSHDLRKAMVDSDRKGYHRFVPTKVKNLQHEEKNLCMCSGQVRDLMLRDVDRQLETEVDAFMLDVVFTLDCTQSMATWLAAAQANIERVAEEISASENVSVRFALVAFRDHPPEDSTFVTQVFDFCDAEELCRHVRGLKARGGGDKPVALADAWHEALEMDWRLRAVKSVVHISDAAPHGIGAMDNSFRDGCPNGHDPIVIVNEMSQRNISLYNVLCDNGGITVHTVWFYEGTASVTGGQMLRIDACEKLPQLLIESCAEQVSLANVTPAVECFVDRLSEQNPFLDPEQLEYLVWVDCIVADVMTNKITVGVAEGISARGEQISECRNLRECRNVWKDLICPICTGWNGGYDALCSVMYTGYKPPQNEQQIQVECRPEHISRYQVRRCLKRIRLAKDFAMWNKQGCIYRLNKYERACAAKRFADHGVQFNNESPKMKVRKWRKGAEIEFRDHRDVTWHYGVVTKVDKESFSVSVSVPRFGSTERSLPLSSVRLKPFGTHLSTREVVRRPYVSKYSRGSKRFRGSGRSRGNWRRGVDMSVIPNKSSSKQPKKSKPFKSVRVKIGAEFVPASQPWSRVVARDVGRPTRSERGQSGRGRGRGQNRQPARRAT